MIGAVVDEIMRLGLDDAVIKKCPRHRVLVLIGRRALGEIGPVVQTVPVAVEIEARDEIAATLNRLIDACLIPLVLRLAADLSVLKENWGVEVGKFAVELSVVNRLLRQGFFLVEGKESKMRQQNKRRKYDCDSNRFHRKTSDIGGKLLSSTYL